MINDDLLYEYLDKLSQGEDVPETSDAGEDFRPVVDTARWLVASRPAFAPRPGFVRASRRRLQTQVSTRCGRKFCGRNPWLMWSWSALHWWQSPRLHVAMVVLLAAVLYFNAAGVLQASRFWLPGDLLYPLKPVAENVRLLGSFSPQRDAELHIEYAHRRLIEVQALVFENRYEQIPSAVANFDYHVSRAVTLVNQVAGYEQDEARGLASSLEDTLSEQMGMVAFLSGFTPEPSQAEFERMMQISTGGVNDIQKLLSPDSSDTRQFGLERVRLLAERLGWKRRS